MIRSFADEKTESVWQGKRIAAFEAFREKAERKLAVLDAAACLEDLGGLPGNRLELLKGNRKGQHPIRINDQWECVSAGRRPMPLTLRSWTTIETPAVFARRPH